MPNTYPVFAVTTRGLEAVSAQEMSKIPGVSITQNAYRRVEATCEKSLKPLLELRTVDDIFLSLATWTNIDHTRAMLPLMREKSIWLNLDRAAATCAMLRSIPSNPTFSISANFVGKRNYSSEDIKTVVAEGVQKRHNWIYTEDDREGDFNLRVFIDHETALVGLRLGTRPLHERSYKLSQLPGSLKPPVAAAMLRLAGIKTGERLLDPCCGVGTILIEGAALGAVAQGGDSEADTVQAAQNNAQAAKMNIPIRQWDARKLPLPDASVDCVVCNLPWGRQIVVDEELKTFYQAICAEIERVLAPGGRAALLTATPDLLPMKHLQPISQTEISLFGQTPTISVFKL